MTTIAYHASHEQFSPNDLLTYVKLAEESRFTACHSSDHFHPWSKRQGQSAFSFAWLGAAMQVTEFPFSLVVAPGQRYHPAIVAQAIATLAVMYPHRFEVALGSGEAINEMITGTPWFEKDRRNERLMECASVIKRLLNGDKVTYAGEIIIQEAMLYTRPTVAPRLMCAALSEETARWAGQWADGLLTVHSEPETLKKIIDAFRNNGGKDKPIHVQMALSYARNENDALEGAWDQWRTNILDASDLADLHRVEQFDEKAESVTREDVKEKIPVGSSPEKFITLIRQDLSLGVSNIILHNVNRDQETFIRDFGKEVIPELNRIKEFATH